MACVTRKIDTAMQKDQEFQMEDLEEITFPDNYVIVDEKSEDIEVSDDDMIEINELEADDEKADEYEDIETTDEEADEEKAVVRVNSDGSLAKCAKGLTEDCGYKAGAKVCGKCGAMAVQIKRKPMIDERDMEDATMGPDDAEADVEVMDDEEPMEAMNTRDRKRRMAARKRRMASMQVKSEEWDDDSFVCGFEGKMLAGTSEPCAACPGGCAPEGDLPTLLEVEGLAEEMLDGKVLESGYADANDMFVVDVLLKDGSVAEAYYDGSTGTCRGWQMLDDNLIGEKSAGQQIEIISMDEAAEIAVKNLPGEIVAIDADIFEGYDAYAVEIEGVDGKSYDGFVSLDGEFLGYDAYNADEASQIDAETAEFELKAAYSEDERMELAEEGMALPDGSYPIKNGDDLKNAIQAYGRAKDKEAAKAHIMKRAADLDMEDMIPESWMSDEGEADEKSADDPEFLSALMEFEMLTLESEIDDTL
jgi:hypothetical protein